MTGEALIELAQKIASGKASEHEKLSFLASLSSLVKDVDKILEKSKK